MPRSPLPRRPALSVEELESREVPAGFFFAGVGGVSDPAAAVARVYNTNSTTTDPAVIPPGDINVFPGFAGDVRVASGDVNGDGVDDLICAQGAGPGSGSLVRIFSGQAAFFSAFTRELASFYVYSDTGGASQAPGFAGGVFVASDDFNNDGFDELVVSPGAGARGHVKVFDFNDGTRGFLGNNPTPRASFYAYTDFAGEVRVTTLRQFVSGTPTPFLVTASGAGTTQNDVRFYANPFALGGVPDGTFVPPVAQFFPFPGYAGGVSVAAGDINFDGTDELFVSQSTGPGVVRVFDARALPQPGFPVTPVREFQPFPGFGGEVRVGAADVDGDGDVDVLTATGACPGAQGSPVKAWDVTGVPVEVRSYFAFPGYTGGVWVSTRDISPFPGFGF